MSQPPGFTDLIGIRLRSVAADEVVAEFEPDDRHRDAAGDVHHGIHASLVETVASVGGWYAARERGLTVLGVSNSTDVLRPHAAGRLEARGRPEHVGEHEQLWSVSIRRAGDGVPVARGQVRLLHVLEREWAPGTEGGRGGRS